MEIAGGPPDETVYVGDSVWDTKAATRASVAAVALLSGGTPRADLEEAGEGGVYTGPADLFAHLNDSAFSRIGAAG
ncbi:HAD family hydrolase [Streptomyces sp. NPDC001890]|uniref:HAD family hydrolase n=1 Tax=Streptomyces sp. NPDC001890 TaxID=3364620 RepID=UPI00368E313E